MPEERDTMPGSERTIVLSDRAADELAAAIAWYQQESAGLGLEFLAAVDSVFALVRRHPNVGVEVRPRVRRALLRRFPYGVFYTTQEARVRILAILHSHRHPARWPRRA
jgi:plasmid stabilization system protein ParE